MSLTKNQKAILDRYFEDLKDEKSGLSLFPFRYETLEVIEEDFWQIGQKIVFKATIISAIKTVYFNRKSITRFRCLTDKNEYDCVIYNNRFVNKALENQEVTIVGTLNDKLQIVVSQMNQKDIKDIVGILPIYSLKENVKQYQIRAIMKKLLKIHYHQIEEILPLDLIEKYKLLSTREAIKEIHFPHSQLHLKQAQRTLKYQEALIYQSAIALAKQDELSIAKSPIIIDQDDIQKFINTLPFELTEDQLRTIQEICDDLQSQKVMRRLVLGDVGSGKTMIAIIAILAVSYLNHAQSAFLCPTEVLASQHFKTLQSFFKDKINIGFLTGSMTLSERDEVISDLMEDKISCIVGTHALFSDSTQFNNLKLVIMDEQHRFGVNQRQALINKGKGVDVLMLSATPIPRTLASSLYSHIDISTIESMPKNRLMVKTKLLKENTITSIVDDVLFRIKQGDQCYVICPTISEDNLLQIRNVDTITKNLQKAFGKIVKIEKIHGQMDKDIIQDNLDKFKNHEIDILVSTTVIEVGIHIENANTMIIYNAERFGLSQLHQLRGRIGRGQKQALCYVLTESSDPNTLNRLEMFESITSGFQLSMIDLKMRGSGDILGIRQSGLPQFNMFNPIFDKAILKVSKQDAQDIIQKRDLDSLNFIKYVKLKQDSILNSMI